MKDIGSGRDTLDIAINLPLLWVLRLTVRAKKEGDNTIYILAARD